MTSTMVRTFAVAALIVGAAAVGTTVEAAPGGGSPFAGKYTGPVPGLSGDDWGSISVSSGGGITFSQPPAGDDGWKMSGSVNGDGTISITGKYHVPGNPGFFTNDLPPSVETRNAVNRSTAGAAAKPSIEFTWYYQANGTVVLGGDGNLYLTVPTANAGSSFVWRRR
jgi:hypothetical protein